MSSDFRFEIAPGNGQLHLTVSGGGLPATGLLLERPSFTLPSDQVDQLRRGDAPPALVQQVTDAVSQWLLAKDLIPFLTQVLGQQNGEPVRLIFTIKDEKLISNFADVPFELLVLPGEVIPLALRQRVASLAYLLPKVRSKPLATTAGNWPFRVLMVHANPRDLGGQVPDVGPIREEILELRPDLGSQHLQIDVLSRQDGEGVVGRPTHTTLAERLNEVPYDVLVYLGHGDLQQTFEDLPPVGVLQLEDDSGEGNTPLFTPQLAQLLHERPVPLVLLIGCLTAGQSVPNKIKDMIPQWMRGSQGVTQALINSESGVQFAVGMRYKIDAAEATSFLVAFFRSLLSNQRGNVEAAVHAGRAAIYQRNPYTSGWSAPMVFRTPGNEPMFRVLSTSTSCPVVSQYQEVRAAIWDTLASQRWSWRQPDGRTPMHTFLEQQEQRMVQVFRQRQASLIMPDRLELHPEENPVTLQVHFYGSVAVDELEGSLVVGDREVDIQAVKATESLKESGYKMLSDVEGNQATFSISKQAHHNDGSLPEGPLLDVRFTLGSSIEVVYPVTIEVLKVNPPQLVCPSDNAVIVAPS
jgi:hypothetical protein